MAISQAQQPVLLNQMGTADPSQPKSEHDVILGVPQGDPILKKTVEPVGQESPGTRQRRILQAAVVKSAADGTPVMDSYRELNKTAASGAAAAANAARGWNDATKQDMYSIIDKNFSTIQNPLEFVKQIKTQTDKMDAVAGRESAASRSFVEANAFNATPQAIQEELQTRSQLLDITEDIIKNTSGLDILGEIALAFIPGKDYSDAVQAMGFHLNPWTAQDTYLKLASKFQGLPSDEKVAQFTAIKTEWLDKLPRGRAATLLLGLIDPKATEDAADTFGGMEAFTAAFDLTMFYGAISSLRKAYGPVTIMSKAGNKKGAAVVNLEVMKGDEEISKASGVKALIANTNSTPFATEKVLPGTTDDIAPAIHEQLFQFRDQINKVLGGLSDEKGFLREGMLDAADKSRAIRRITDEFQQWTSQALKGENKIIRLQSQKETPRGVEFEFEVTDPFGNVSLGKTMMPFKREDVTFWQNLPDNTVSSKFGSERWQAAKSDFLTSVESAIRLDTTSAAVGSQLRKLIKEATRPIRETKVKGKNRSERLKEVDAMLIYGDQKQKVFTAKELRQGVNGITLDDAQIESYWKLRTTFDGLGVLRNQEMFVDLSARGAKQINFGHDLFRFGEVKHTAEEAAATISADRDIKAVWMHEGRDAGKTVNVAKMDLEKLYKEGYRLIRLEDDVARPGGIFKHILTKVDGLTDGRKTIDELPGIVADLKKGYVPRLNKEATWFVQAVSDGFVDGTFRAAGRRKAVRSFDNEADAHAWAKGLYENPEDAGFTPGTRFIAVKDGELEAFRAGDSGLGATRGLVTGARAKEAIPHGLPGENSIDSARVGAFESLELYLENTKNFMTRNAWRMGLRTKWENTAKELLGGIRVKFDEPGPALANKKLADMHARIMEWSGFRDKSERSFEEFVRKTYEWALPVFGRNKLTKFLLNNRDADPLGKLRSAAFHSLLGTYNPAQLWVQAQGAAVALAASLARGGIKTVVKAFTQQQGLAFVQHLPSDLPEGVMRTLAKAHGFKDVQEMKDMKQIWDRSGYYDSALTSADVEAASRGYGTTAEGFHKFFDSGLVFFRSGEMFNRRYSFITAIEELGGASKVAKSDDLLKEAITRSNNLMLNLGRANRAAWQKGFLSIPTQFMQIQAKTLESIFGLNKTLSPAERLSMFISQAILYGPAGIMGGHFMTKAALSLGGVDQIDINNWSPSTVAIANGGLTDFSLAFWGVDGSMSDRAALFNGMDQSIISLWTKDNTLAEWLLGPSGVPLKRVWQAWSLASVPAWSPKSTDGSVNATHQDVTDALTFFAADMGELAVSPFSTASQVSRFFMMKDLGVIKDTQGNTIANPEGGYNPQTIWAGLLGIKPNDLQRKFDLADMNKAYEDAADLRVNMLLRNFDEYMMTVNQHLENQTPFEAESQRLFRKRWSIIVDSIEDEGLRDKVRQRWGEALERRLSGDSQLDRQIQVYYKNMVTELVGAHTSEGTRLVQTRENENGVQ